MRAPYWRALPAPQAIGRISQKKARRSDVPSVCAQTRLVRFHTSAHRNDGAERYDRHA
jgi:hypothetical protein